MMNKKSNHLQRDLELETADHLFKIKDIHIFVDFLKKLKKNIFQCSSYVQKSGSLVHLTRAIQCSELDSIPSNSAAIIHNE